MLLPEKLPETTLHMTPLPQPNALSFFWAMSRPAALWVYDEPTQWLLREPHMFWSGGQPWPYKPGHSWDCRETLISTFTRFHPEIHRKHKMSKVAFNTAGLPSTVQIYNRALIWSCTNCPHQFSVGPTLWPFLLPPPEKSSLVLARTFTW